MRESFDYQLNKLNIMLMNMATYVEQIIAMSVKSLKEKDIELAKETMDFDNKINDVERDIERLCLKLLLRYQPVFADDLRRVSTVLKMITDMERIGDQAADIAEINSFIIEQNKELDIEKISKMAISTATMVTNSIDAYINQDETLAQTVIDSDDEIDDLFASIKAEIIDKVVIDKQVAEQAVDTVMIAKYFERIGDHAVNVAEWVLFSITGVHKTTKIL